MTTAIVVCDHAHEHDVCATCRHAHPHQAGYTPLRYCRDWGVCVIDHGRKAVAVRCVLVRRGGEVTP